VAARAGRRTNRTAKQRAYTARQKREARKRRTAAHNSKSWGTRSHAGGRRRRKNPRSTRKGMVRKTARRAYEPRRKNPQLAGVDLTDASVNALGVMVGGAGASAVTNALDSYVVDKVPAAARGLAYAALTVGVVWGAMYAATRAKGRLKTALPYLAGAIGGSLGAATIQTLRSSLGMSGMGRTRRRRRMRGTIDPGEPIGFMNGGGRGWGIPQNPGGGMWNGTIDQGQPIGVMQGTIHQAGAALPAARGYMRATL
jgi:hypothetical protein